MQFKEFLTEVSTGDILAFNQAVRKGDFHPDKYVGRDYGEPNAYEEINEFFEKRGYKRIGSGAFSTVLQSKDHYVVKVASQDVAFSSYADLTRSGRMNSLFPRIIAVTNVPLNKHYGSDEAVKVYFVERLFPLQSIAVEELIKHHTERDAPMFLWMVGGFLGHPLEAEKMRKVAMTLNPELSVEPIPIHPGFGDEKKSNQYYEDKETYITSERLLNVQEVTIPFSRHFLR